MGTLIKAAGIKVAEKVRIDVPQANTGCDNHQKASRTNAKALVVEKQGDFSVIEITCTCGNKTYVRCEHGGANSESPPQQKEEKTQ